MIADGSIAKIMAKYGFTEAEKTPSITQDQILNGQRLIAIPSIGRLA